MIVVHWYDFLLRLGVAVCAGALIGVERQWRSRGAGLRTNTLVAAGAAMFVLISRMTPSGRTRRRSPPTSSAASGSLAPA
jgi:putative Mg2+ transporter-C (MgtC) family protein